MLIVSPRRSIWTWRLPGGSRPWTISRPRDQGAHPPGVGRSEGASAPRDRIEHLKKGDMATEAETLLADSGWLPEPLRTQGRPPRRTFDGAEDDR